MLRSVALLAVWLASMAAHAKDTKCDMGKLADTPPATREELVAELESARQERVAQEKRLDTVRGYSFQRGLTREEAERQQAIINLAALGGTLVGGVLAGIASFNLQLPPDWHVWLAGGGPLLGMTAGGGGAILGFDAVANARAAAERGRAVAEAQKALDAVDARIRALEERLAELQ